VLDQEATLLSRMVRRIRGRIYELNTDSVLYAGNAIEEDGWRCEITK